MKRQHKNGMMSQHDEDDADLAALPGWYPVKDGRQSWHLYAQQTRPDGGLTTVKFHRLVAARMFGDEAIVGRRIDHINRDGLDNRRSNLRLAGASENATNVEKRRMPQGTSSQYKGVYLHKPTGRWLAQIRLGEVKKHLGYFEDEQQAALAFDVAARERNSSFEKLNFTWKTCTGRCGRELPEMAYAQRPNRTSGRASRCKECVAADKRDRQA